MSVSFSNIVGVRLATKVPAKAVVILEAMSPWTAKMSSRSFVVS